MGLLFCNHNCTIFSHRNLNGYNNNVEKTKQKKNYLKAVDWLSFPDRRQFGRYYRNVIHKRWLPVAWLFTNFTYKRNQALWTTHLVIPTVTSIQFFVVFIFFISWLLLLLLFFLWFNHHHRHFKKWRIHTKTHTHTSGTANGFFSNNEYVHNKDLSYRMKSE